MALYEVRIKTRKRKVGEAVEVVIEAKDDNDDL
jgi:hypothetical protein